MRSRGSWTGNLQGLGSNISKQSLATHMFQQKTWVVDSGSGCMIPSSFLSLSSPSEGCQARPQHTHTEM